MKLDNVIALSLFAAYTLKAGILGASLADALIILGLGAATFLYSKITEKSELKVLQTQIEELKKIQFDHNTIISELRTNVTGIKLGQTYKKAQ